MNEAKSIIRFGFFLIAITALALSGCMNPMQPDVTNNTDPNMDSSDTIDEPNGTVSLSLIVPDYSLLHEKNDVSTKMIHPDTAAIKIIFDGVEVASASLTDGSTQDNSYFPYQWDHTFSVPVGTYSTVTVELLDGSSNLLTTGEVSNVTINESPTTSISVVTFPASYSTLTMNGSDLTGSVSYQGMTYFAFDASAGVDYTVSITSTEQFDIYMFEPSGLRSGTSSGIDYYFAGTGGDSFTHTADYSGLYFIGVYGYAGEDGAVGDNFNIGVSATASTTSGDLLLTKTFTGDPDWVELTNAGSTHVDLSGYSLTIDGGTTLPLPAYFLASGESVIVVESGYTGPEGSINATSGTIPWGSTGSSGAAAIVRESDGYGLDFVRWNTSTDLPVSPDTWSETGGTIAAPDASLDEALVRDGTTDTDDSNDWYIGASFAPTTINSVYWYSYSDTVANGTTTVFSPTSALTSYYSVTEQSSSISSPPTGYDAIVMSDNDAGTFDLSAFAGTVIVTIDSAVDGLMYDLFGDYKYGSYWDYTSGSTVTWLEPSWTSESGTNGNAEIVSGAITSDSTYTFTRRNDLIEANTGTNGQDTVIIYEIENDSNHWWWLHVGSFDSNYPTAASEVIKYAFDVLSGK